MEIYFHQLTYLSLVKEWHVKFQEGNKEEQVPGFQELITLVKGIGIYYFTDITFKSTGTRNVLHKQKGRTRTY